MHSLSYLSLIRIVSKAFTLIKSIHDGKYSEWAIDPVSLVMYAYNEIKQAINILDLSTPSAIKSFREVKVPLLRNWSNLKS